MGHGDAGCVAGPIGAKGDRAGEDVALGGDEGEGAVVGVDDDHAGCQRRAARPLQVDDGHLARLDARSGAVEVAALRPVVAEARLPAADDLLGCNVGAGKAHAIGLAPQLAEAALRPGQFAATDV